MAKPRKVEDRATPYVANSPKQSKRAVSRSPKSSAAASTRYADSAAFKKAATKVFTTHSELFRKLAQ
jgi:hypothetical protein